MPGPRTYEYYAERVGYEWGWHGVSCPCGAAARLQLDHDQAVVTCESCGWFKLHRRRHGWGPKRQPTGGTPRRTLDQMDAVWIRTVPIRGTLGEEIFNLTHRKCLGADEDVHYVIEDLGGIFRYHPGHRSVCALLADEKSDYLCGLLEMFIAHSGFVFSERITGERGKIWPSLEMLARSAIGPQEGDDV